MIDWPEVTMADVFADQQFFADHPERRYRSRPSSDGRVWLVRRQDKDAFLRTLSRSPLRCPDSDAALARLWVEAVRHSVT